MQKKIEHSYKIKPMQRAINETEGNLIEAAAAPLRVVHSPRTIENPEPPGTEEATDQNAPPQTGTRSNSPIHYSRSYHPDGPAGKYPGL